MDISLSVFVATGRHQANLRENDQDAVLYPKGDEILVLRNEIKKHAIEMQSSKGSSELRMGAGEISRSRSLSLSVEEGTGRVSGWTEI